MYRSLRVVWNVQMQHKSLLLLQLYTYESVDVMINAYAYVHAYICTVYVSLASCSSMRNCNLFTAVSIYFDTLLNICRFPEFEIQNIPNQILIFQKLYYYIPKWILLYSKLKWILKYSLIQRCVLRTANVIHVLLGLGERDLAKLKNCRNVKFWSR